MSLSLGLALGVGLHARGVGGNFLGLPRVGGFSDAPERWEEAPIGCGCAALACSLVLDDLTARRLACGVVRSCGEGLSSRLLVSCICTGVPKGVVGVDVPLTVIVEVRGFTILVVGIHRVC